MANHTKTITLTETQQKILGYLKQLGFIMKGKINMYNCGYENQYLYILQKPK